MSPTAEPMHKIGELADTSGVTASMGPVDQPYGYREYGAHDGEGHLWSFMKPLNS
ncbi:MAG: hypothetical protein R8F63_08270 [Acidimicrobiales bacterium]|nr:hypothetical protein [Acidimicrobiales bacterium]